MGLKSLKQDRQQFAFDCISEIKSAHGGLPSKYKSLCEELGMMLFTNGLVSSMAKYNGNSSIRERNECNFMVDHIFGWMHNRGLIESNVFSMNDLVQVDSTKMMQLTKEVVLLSDALKEMAKSEIKEQ